MFGDGQTSPPMNDCKLNVVQPVSSSSPPYTEQGLRYELTKSQKIDLMD